MVKRYNIKVEKMSNQAKFMKRVFRIAQWLHKRYNLDDRYIMVDFNYGYRPFQKENGLVTIELYFHG